MVVESRQLDLTGSGPATGDRFRFSWWNTAAGAAVWVEYRGRWRKGIVRLRGYKFVWVEVEAAAGQTYRTRKAYGELRRRVESPPRKAVSN
jgi:hypothetical protein